MKRTATPIRLALRAEGDWWVAYIATTINMEQRIEIGRINIRAMQEVPDGADRWKLLMTDMLAAQMTGIGLPPLSWDERPAPESERSGRS